MADIKVSIASPVIEEEEINAVIDVMKSGMIACSSFSSWNWRRG